MAEAQPFGISPVVGAAAGNLASLTAGGLLGDSGVSSAVGPSTITLGGSLTFSRAHSTTFAVTGNTSVTLPTSGTLATTTQLSAYLALSGNTMDAGAAISWGSESVAIYGDANGQLWLSSANSYPINLNGLEINASGYFVAPATSSTTLVASAIASQTGNLFGNLDVNGNLLSGFDVNGQIFSYGENWTLNNLAVPTGLTVTPHGATGSTHYGYRVAALNAQGTTLACAEVVTTTGNASLTGSNYNLVAWNACQGATSYKLYGRTSGAELLMVTVQGTGASAYSYNDTGAATPSGALPGNPVGTGLTISTWSGQTGNQITGTGFSFTSKGTFIMPVGAVYGIVGSDGSPVLGSSSNKHYQYCGSAGYQIQNSTDTGVVAFWNDTSSASYVPMGLAAYTVSGLPAGSNGQIAYASNGRKAGEGVGSGTGVPVIYTNSAWYSLFSGAAVTA